MAEGTTRVRLTDDEFFRINEEVAASDNPTIAEVAKRTGLKPASVTQRRNLFNRTYRKEGLELASLKRGGGAKKNVHETAQRLLAMRAEMAGGADTAEEATPTQE